MRTSIAHTDRPPALSAFVPPLDIAREQARRTLREANALDMDTADSITVAGEFGALRETLRQVLAALDVDDAKAAPDPQDRPETMTVRVCDRGSGRDYVGVTIRTITIPAVCPVCGGPRGVDTLRSERLPEDGESYTVSRWDNPCGHVDLYADVLREARAYSGSGDRRA
ncbi:hypothetical protein AB0D27_11120 [Streptomyces sp. NPDC048415]|uniref:hypothetical protein n=1 Tax=Streptomyces sp. NPDC048415 TaxID=3154822 RepID=UPI003419BCA5